MPITFELFNETGNTVTLNSDEFQTVLPLIASDHQCTLGWINAIILDNAPHTRLNIKYLNHNYDTDVLTFDLSNDKETCGEVYINYDIAKSNAEAYKQTIEMELCRLIIHGVLHLCGQGDKTNEEQRSMRSKEDLYLKRFM